VFDSAKKRQDRIDFIKQQVDKDGESVAYEFHTVDTMIMTDAEMQEWET
jgi:hypothetical protein